MPDKFVGAMSPETEKTLDKKLAFKNRWAELGDGYLIKVIDNNILEPLINKLPNDGTKELVQSMLAEVIEEMPVVEI